MGEENRGSNYLEVVKEDERPEWPVEESELEVGSQTLESGYVQYWAYPKNSGKNSEELPSAETLAQKHFTPKPAVLVDLLSEAPLLLELILVRGGHAWSKTESNLANLEDNLTTLLDFAKKRFNMSVEHFMTTEKVPEEVEKKLDNLEGSSEEGVEEGAEQDSTQPEIRHVNTPSSQYFSSHPTPAFSNNSSPASPLPKLLILIPAALILMAFLAVAFIKREKVLTLLGRGSAQVVQVGTTPTPTPEPTPTPTPVVDRSEMKVRVLNGTRKSGAAATLTEKLKGLGWQVVATGNAPDTNTPQTTVKVKGGLEEAAKVLVVDLGSDFEATTGANLKLSDRADAEVVIGQK